MCPPKFLELLRAPGFVEQTVDRAGGGPVVDTQRPQPVAQPFTFAHVADLTHTLSPASPVFPSLPAFVVEQPFATHEAHGVSINRYTLSDHCGTHFDAPYHVSRHGLHTDEVSVRSLVAPAVVVDIGGKA